jgi:uncharacterized protein (DUF2336 family)
MILNQFRVWARQATPSQRADGASALARAYLYSDLTAEERADAADVLTGLLDDASPLVRRALAEAFANAPDAPHHIVLALAEDQAAIAAIVLAQSPLLTDAELIDCAAIAEAQAQRAIAERLDLSMPVAAALAEVGEVEALVALANNHHVSLPEFSMLRMIERAGSVANIREGLLARPDLPVVVRVELVNATARALSAFVSRRNWMPDARLARLERDASDRAAVIIADESEHRASVLQLVAHLRATGQLTLNFVFRTLLGGRLELFKAALSDLSGLSMARIDGLVRQFESNGFAALCRKAGLPDECLFVMRLALCAFRDAEWDTFGGAALSRQIVTRVLAACERQGAAATDQLIVMLRRFEAEAARDASRLSASGDTPLALTADPRDEPLRLTDLDEGLTEPQDDVTRNSATILAWPIDPIVAAPQAELYAA